MKWVLVVMLGVLLLTGCGGPTTFTDRTYHFSITYDSRLFQRQPAHLTMRLLLVHKGDGHVFVYADRIDTHIASEMLSRWGKGQPVVNSPTEPWYFGVGGAAKARWVTLNGLRGMRVDDSDAHGRSISYMFVRGSDFYLCSAGTRKEDWTADGHLLESILQSFRVTK